MSDFECKIKLDKVPREVRVGTSIKVLAEIEESNKPVRNIIFCVDKYNMRNALKKGDDNIFRLDFPIPTGTERGLYDVSFWAVSEEGEKSVPIKLKITLQ